MSAFGVRRDKAALSTGCKPHPATAPAGSNRSSHPGVVQGGSRRCSKRTTPHSRAAARNRENYREAFRITDNSGRLRGSGARGPLGAARYRREPIGARSRWLEGDTEGVRHLYARSGGGSQNFRNRGGAPMPPNPREADVWARSAFRLRGSLVPRATGVQSICAIGRDAEPSPGQKGGGTGGGHAPAPQTVSVSPLCGVNRPLLLRCGKFGF